MSTEEEAQQTAIAKETQAILAMPEAERFQYVSGVVQGLANGLKAIMMEKKKLRQAKMANQLLDELDKKATTLIPAIIYTVKQKYQPIYIHFLNELAALMEKR